MQLDPRAPRVRKKFKRLIALARRQIQLQGDHEGGAVKFLEDMRAVKAARAAVKAARAQGCKSAAVVRQLTTGAYKCAN